MKMQPWFALRNAGMTTTAIPKTHYGSLQGFLEILDDIGSKSDLAGVALKQGLELDDLLPIVEAGEMFGLIQIQTGDVLLTEKGHLFIAASPKVRKKMLHDMVLNIDAFKKFADYLKKRGSQSISREDLLKFFSESAGALDNNNTQDATNDFNWFIEWGRQGLVLTYDANSETITLRKNKL
jgi:NitT/TauT family transport system ATP-binding protein